MTSIEMAISVGFFSAYAQYPILYFGLEAVNGLGSKGEAKFKIFGVPHYFILFSFLFLYELGSFAYIPNTAPVGLQSHYLSAVSPLP